MSLKDLRVGSSVVVSSAIAGAQYEDLMNIVRGYCQSSKFSTHVKAMKADLLKEAKDKLSLSGPVEVRRDHDGISEMGWLLEKMMGEYLIDGKINW